MIEYIPLYNYDKNAHISINAKFKKLNRFNIELRLSNLAELNILNLKEIMRITRTSMIKKSVYYI